MFLATGPAFAGQEYHLGTGDLLEIKVVDRPAVSGRFRIRPPGEISLPIVGVIPAAGFTPTELERAISQKFGRRKGRDENLVTVEILEYRPYFIVGRVKNSGRYPYIVGMTVLHAVAVAGGFPRFSRDTFFQRLEVDRTRGKWRLLAQTLGYAISARARLEAELSGASEVVFPAELGRYLSPEQGEITMRNERLLFEVRRNATKTQQTLLERQKHAYRNEIAAYGRQIKAARERARLLEEELGTLRNASGGTVVPRSHTLQLMRLQAGAKGDIRALQSAIAKAQARVARIEQEIASLGSQRRSKSRQALERVQKEIAQTRLSLQENAQILSEYGGDEPLAGSPEGASSYRIFRQMPEGPVEIVADEQTELRPGDLVKVLGASRRGLFGDSTSTPAPKSGAGPAGSR